MAKFNLVGEECAMVCFLACDYLVVSDTQGKEEYHGAHYFRMDDFIYMYFNYRDDVLVLDHVVGKHYTELTIDAKYLAFFTGEE